jgi:hypothetical protein
MATCLGLLLICFSANTFAKDDAFKCGDPDDMKADWGGESGICTKGKDIHLYSGRLDMSGHYIRIEAGKFEEVEPSGKVVRTVKLKTDSKAAALDVSLSGNVWSAVLTESKELKVKGSDSHYEDESVATEFTRRLDFGMLTTNSYTCSACDIGGGECRRERPNGSICKRWDAGHRCPVRGNWTPCFSSTEDRIIKITYSVKDWPFASSENTLRYSVELTVKEDKKVFASDDEEPQEFDLAAFLGEPTTFSTFEDASGSYTQLEANAIVSNKGKNSVELIVESPYAAPGQTFFYGNRVNW